MRTIKWLSYLAVVALLLGVRTAAAQEAQARIVKILGAGTATVVIDGRAEAALEQMLVPVNAEIRTSSQEVYLEVIPGVVSSVKPQSDVRVDTLEGAEPALELRQGTLVSEIDKKRVAGKTYAVKTARGIAAARGTSFTVSLGADSLAVATTADSVSFTTAAGAEVMIPAGTISITPAAAVDVAPAIPIGTAIASNPTVVNLVQDAVATVVTVVQANLGDISAESATNIISQVVAVAVAAVPQQAASFTSQAVAAVTAAGAATASAADTAAGAVTAAAVKSAPDQAAQITVAAAQAAPASLTGVITAAAQQVAPSQSDAIAQQVANATGQSSSTIQSSANAAAPQASHAVNAANDATSHVVPAPAAQTPSASPSTSTSQPSQTTSPTQSAEHANAPSNDQAKGPNAAPGQGDTGKVSPHPPVVAGPPTTPVTPIDPAEVSPSS